MQKIRISKFETCFVLLVGYVVRLLFLFHWALPRQPAYGQVPLISASRVDLDTAAIYI